MFLVISDHDKNSLTKKSVKKKNCIQSKNIFMLISIYLVHKIKIYYFHKIVLQRVVGLWEEGTTSEPMSMMCEKGT